MNPKGNIWKYGSISKNRVPRKPHGHFRVYVPFQIAIFLRYKYHIERQSCGFVDVFGSEIVTPCVIQAGNVLPRPRPAGPVKTTPKSMAKHYQIMFVRWISPSKTIKNHSNTMCCFASWICLGWDGFQISEFSSGLRFTFFASARNWKVILFCRPTCNAAGHIASGLALATAISPWAARMLPPCPRRLRRRLRWSRPTVRFHRLGTAWRTLW